MAGREQLSIAQVTPHPWGSGHEINEFVDRVSAELGERGHRVLVAAPSAVRAGVRESRRAIASLARGENPSFDGGWRGARAGDGNGPPVLALGSGIPMPHGPRPRAAPLPVDVSRALEQLLGGVELDVVHVHDPFAPSLSSAALRHSRSLNVGSFHEPSERVLSTQVARPLVEVFLGRLDARTVSCATTAELLDRFFPATHELVEPGADPRPQAWWPGADGAAGRRPVRIAFCEREERGALRLFLRAIRRLSPELDWEAAVWVDRPADLRLSQRLRGRVSIVRPREASPEALIAAADVVCAASGGPRTAPALLRAALASETVPVASQIPLYD